ncbi:MAG: hypothetical protein KDJ52_30055 [Anaerolineae bacterium]|nr:hypothetical protein [Anaerolineae bacterium]
MSQKQNRPAARAATTKQRDKIDSGLILDLYDTTIRAQKQFPQLNNHASRRRELSDRLEAIEQAIKAATAAGNDNGLLLADWMDTNQALTDLAKPQYQNRFTLPETLGYIARIGARLHVDGDNALIVEPADIPDDLAAAIKLHGAKLVAYVSAHDDRVWPGWDGE